MGTKYETEAIVGFNSSPPVDDGTVSEANKVKWATTKDKLADPIKDQVANIDAKLVSMADIGSDGKSVDYTTLTTDHQKTLEVTATAVTITLLAVASAPSGYTVTVKNNSGSTVDVTASGSETIDGSTTTVTLADMETYVVQLDQGGTGYISLQQVTLTGGAGLISANTFTNTQTYTHASPLIFEGATADAFETTFAVEDPTADNTLTIPDKTGTIAIDSEMLAFSHIKGLILSNDTDTDHDINITTGAAVNSSNASLLTLSSEITKQIDASWATGDDAGGLSSSLTVANSTWYHVFLVTIAGATDVIFDTSVTCANGVADHTVTSYRRIGSVLTDGSANILDFIQYGDKFMWGAPVQDRNTTANSTRISVTLSVPLGVKTRAIIYINIAAIAAAARFMRVMDLDLPDVATDSINCSILSHDLNGGYQHSNIIDVVTNTSSQVGLRSSNADSSNVINTHGWIDNRGQN